MAVKHPSSTERADGSPGDRQAGQTRQPSTRGPFSPTILLGLVVLIAIAGGVAVLTIGGGKAKANTCGPGTSSHQFKFCGSLASPPQPAPPLALRNYRGEPINIDRYRGKAVLVTFLYTKCPDVCPIIASNLGVALNLMGSATASKVQVIAVSVDPRSDTPAAVASFLRRHGVLGRMQYLIGSARELSRVWRAWGVGSEQDAQQPQFVNHTGIVYGVDGAGRMTTLYAANFTPQEIVHDAPLLAAN
jgi:protein SCO1